MIKDRIRLNCAGFILNFNGLVPDIKRKFCR